MQTKVTIALVAAAFALASYPAFAADMPADGTKNFTAPGGAPSYFANETVPASARVANQATFTDDEVTAPEVGQSVADRGGTRGSAGKSTKRASGKSKGSSGSTYYVKASSSKLTPTAAARSTGSSAGAGKSGMPAGASKANTTKHAKSSIRHQAAVVPPRTAATSFA